VSCHSPDGIEIAAYAFSDEDITRRAVGHLSMADAKQIVGLVHDVRKRYHITSLLDPMQDRPMQPGGELLSGSTPMERDATFASILPAKLPLFFARSIRSLALAKAARDQILNLDLSSLKIGIPMNRLSEDFFHGTEHGTIADWLSDMPMAREIPTDVQDAYLADPSEQNYLALDRALSDIAPREVTLAQNLSFLKRRSLLYFQHNLRNKLLGVSSGVPISAPNPMWNIGEFGRASANTRVSMLGLPDDIAAKKTIGPPDAEQIKGLRLAWYWLGWCMDPGLQKTSPLNQTRRADYFSSFMWSDGPYPMHLAFMLTRKIATESFMPASWSLASPQHLDLNYTYLVNDQGIAGPLPQAPEHKKLFDAFIANSFRMNLYLQIDELSKTRTVYLPLALRQQVRRMKVIFTDPRDKALADHALAVIDTCKEQRP